MKTKRRFLYLAMSLSTEDEKPPKRQKCEPQTRQIESQAHRFVDYYYYR